MQIADILHHKGSEIVTILPTETIEAAAKKLATKRIGALVVKDRIGRLTGMLSERDIVTALAGNGPSALAMKVEDVMTREVVTCKPTDAVRELMALITIRRIRHVPVVDDGRMVGVVSIGDVLKSRLDEKEQEVAILRDLTLVRG